MLCKLKIELDNDTSYLPHALISREALSEFAQAKDLIKRANEQAEELLHQAHIKRQSLLQEAGVEFWLRADAQLQRWENDRQRMCDSIEHYATSIANAAIHHLLDEPPEPKRIAALLKQLLASQISAVSATLFCHPAEIGDIGQYLSKHAINRWKLQSDDTVKPQTLLLQTEEGDFAIGWASMLDALLKQKSSS